MNEILIYTDKCLSCKESDKLFRVMQFAKFNGFKLITININKEPEKKEEATQKSTLQVPFIYHNGKSIDFNTVTQLTLQELL